MTPFELEVLLWYHSRTTDHDAMFSAPIWPQEIEHMIALGLMERTLTPEDVAGVRYRMTEKGHFYVMGGLCLVPLPEQRFVIVWHGPDKITIDDAAL